MEWGGVGWVGRGRGVASAPPLDKQCAGPKLDQVFNYKHVGLYAVHLRLFEEKRSNLKLKTQLRLTQRTSTHKVTVPI